jgi:hypothetical protein
MPAPRRWPRPCRNQPKRSIASRSADHAPWVDKPVLGRRTREVGPEHTRLLRASLLVKDLAHADNTHYLQREGTPFGVPSVSVPTWSRAWSFGGRDGCWQRAGRIVRPATSRARSLTGGPSGQPGLARGAWVSPTRQQAFYARDADQHPLRHRHGCCVRGDSGRAP